MRPWSRVGVIPLLLLLIAVPTFYGVIVEATEWPMLVRVVTLLGWLGIAVYAAFGQLDHEDRVAEVVEREHDHLEKGRAVALTTLLDLAVAQITDRHPLLEPAIYLPGEARLHLLPFSPSLVSDLADPRVFSIGSGATGEAWTRGETVLVLGDEVSNADHGLTPEQQQHFADRTAVAATPIRGDSGRLVGVVTAISAFDDGSLGSVTPDAQYVNGPAIELLEEIAEWLGSPVEALVAKVG